MSIVDSAWLAAGATSRRHSAASRAEVQMTAGVEPSRVGTVFETNADIARPEAPLQGVDELLHPSDGRHHALRYTAREGHVRHAEQERCAEACRVAGVSAVERGTEQPPGRPKSQDSRTPLLDGLERPRSREPRAVAVTNRATSESDSQGLNGHRLGRRR